MQLVIKTFGDMLSYPEVESLTEFPSPDALRHRIIISTKLPKEFLEEKGDKQDKDNDSPGKRDLSDDGEHEFLNDIDWVGKIQ